MNKAWNNEKFINESKKIHGNVYCYSKCVYEKMNNKVILICSKHGEFSTWPRGHLKQKVGCPYCSLKPKLNTSLVLDLFQSLKTGYDYSKFIYKDSKTKSIIICPIHGEFNQSYIHHYKLKQKCPKCVKIKNGDKLRLSIITFIKRSKKVHGDLYNYEKTDYFRYNKKLNIICKKHGAFSQTPNSHLRGEGCPNCKKSKGENIIKEYLLKNNIKFFPQYKFTHCKNKRLLAFDFYLPNYNLCIEYDGKQHFNPIRFFGGLESFNYMKNNDLIKNKYCIKENIKLLRIKYNEYKHINKILNENL
jgi:very-short-patch-repair endonuclease